jgi:hypothetical protein
LGSLFNFSLKSALEVFVKLDLGGSKDGCLSEGEVGVVDETAEEPHEGFLELVVGLGRDVVVLEVLLAVESDLLGLDLAVLDVNLVSDKNNGDVFADTCKILEPLGDVRVGDAGADIEHDDAAVSSDVVTITKSSKFLLASGIPNVEQDIAVGSEEGHGVNFDTEGGDVFLFELAGQVTLDESGLADTSISNEDELELGHLLFNHLQFKVSDLEVNKGCYHFMAFRGKRVQAGECRYLRFA